MKTFLLVLVPLLLLATACGPTAREQAAELALAQLVTSATETAVAVPTAAAHQTAEAAATQSANAAATAQSVATAQSLATAQVVATNQAVATASAIAQATQQAKELDDRVQAAVAATQQAVPTATPVPPTPVVIVVPQQQSAPPVYVPVPVPAQTGSAPLYVIHAINEANNATTSAKWLLNRNELFGHIIGRELARSDQNVRTLIDRRTRVTSKLISGYVISWFMDSPTHVTATSDETWHFINLDADSYSVKNDLGARVYHNIYTIEYVGGLGWRVSYDDVPNPNGQPV